MGRLIVVLGSLAVGLGLTMWYYQPARQYVQAPIDTRSDEKSWLHKLYSQNPTESEEAARHVQQLGLAALPAIRVALQDPQADRDRRKAALKACAVLGPIAAPAMVDVAAALPEPELTTEAAVALSFMGQGAFEPLRNAVSSDDPVVRREALRSIGKLKERASLEAGRVVPLLIERMEDDDPGVRMVAATYLGIIHSGEESLAALIDGLQDPEADVRRSSAAALGSFGEAAAQALPALRKAAVDPDEDVAREAGVTLVKLQPVAATDPKPEPRTRRRRR